MSICCKKFLLKLCKPTSISSVRSHFLSMRCINVWNYPSQEIGSSQSVTAFKKGLVTYISNIICVYFHEVRQVIKSGHASVFSLWEPVMFLTPAIHCFITILPENCACWFVQLNTIKYNRPWREATIWRILIVQDVCSCKLRQDNVEMSTMHDDDTRLLYVTTIRRICLV